MFPSMSLAQEIGLGVLLVAALVWVLGLGHMLWDSRFHDREPVRLQGNGLSTIPGQRGPSAHPMETVQLTEAEEQAFAGLVRTIALR
ncbi:hypothetical protein ACN20G_21210 [Streptomyces sp. BI20]|uniref:hypothetical protein n=1 Tax=Streptomyces sp. BI20 TaxID=3403460 RepID=UPI003C77B959